MRKLLVPIRIILGLALLSVILLKIFDNDCSSKAAVKNEREVRKSYPAEDQEVPIDARIKYLRDMAKIQSTTDHSLKPIATLLKNLVLTVDDHKKINLREVLKQPFAIRLDTIDEPIIRPQERGQASGNQPVGTNTKVDFKESQDKKRSDECHGKADN